MLMLEFENHYKNNKETPSKNIFVPCFRRGIQVLKRQKSMEKFPNTGSIHLVIVSDEEIKELNRTYRAKNKPTDVLSFSYYQEKGFPGEENVLGEIVISLDTAKKQAKEHQKTLKEELQFLFVHGFLHLFGYDHEEAAERKIMFNLQDEVLGTKSWRKFIG